MGLPALVIIYRPSSRSGTSQEQAVCLPLIAAISHSMHIYCRCITNTTHHISQQPFLQSHTDRVDSTRPAIDPKADCRARKLHSEIGFHCIPQQVQPTSCATQQTSAVPCPTRHKLPICYLRPHVSSSSSSPVLKLPPQALAATRASQRSVRPSHLIAKPHVIASDNLNLISIRLCYINIDSKAILFSPRLLGLFS